MTKNYTFRVFLDATAQLHTDMRHLFSNNNDSYRPRVLLLPLLFEMIQIRSEYKVFDIITFY